MARAPVSKTEQFSFAIKTHSEKTAKFGPNSVNRLDRVSEYRRERMAAFDWLPSWIRIEPCALPQSRRFGVFEEQVSGLRKPRDCATVLFNMAGSNC